MKRLVIKFKKLTQSRFVRNMAIVATGTAGAQAITMAFAPIVTRLYGPEAFGLLGIFMAILAVMAPTAALTYPIAIVLPKKDADARGLAILSVMLAVAMSTLVLILVLVCGDWLADQFGAGDIRHYLWLIPFAMLFAALHQVFEQWLIRHHQFKVTARVAVTQSVVLNITKAGAGLLYPLAAVLIVLQALASALYALLLWLGVRKSNPFKSIEKSSYSLKQLATKYRDFPLFRAPEVAIDALSQGLPVLMLAAFFGPASAGFYTLGRAVMGVPVSLLGKSVADVFYPHISQAANNGEAIYPLVRKATLLMAAIGFIPFAVVIAVGPWLFSLVFGSEWIVAGEYARWMAVWIFFSFINKPTVQVIPIIKAQLFNLITTICSLIIWAAALFFAYYFYKSDTVAIMLFSLAGALINLVLIIIVLEKCKAFDAEAE